MLASLAMRRRLASTPASSLRRAARAAGSGSGSPAPPQFCCRDPQTFELVAQLAYLGGKSQIIEINIGEEVRLGVDPLANTLEVAQPAFASSTTICPPASARVGSICGSGCW